MSTHMFLWRNKINIMWIPPLICSYVAVATDALRVNRNYLELQINEVIRFIISNTKFENYNATGAEKSNTEIEALLAIITTKAPDTFKYFFCDFSFFFQRN